MKTAGIQELPLYPEVRACKRPTTEKILQLFSLAQRHVLMREGSAVQTFEMGLTALQQQVLGLLGVPQSAYVLSS